MSTDGTDVHAQDAPDAGFAPFLRGISGHKVNVVDRVPRTDAPYATPFTSRAEVSVASPGGESSKSYHERPAYGHVLGKTQGHELKGTLQNLLPYVKQLAVADIDVLSHVDLDVRSALSANLSLTEISSNASSQLPGGAIQFNKFACSDPALLAQLEPSVRATLSRKLALLHGAVATPKDHPVWGFGIPLAVPSVSSFALSPGYAGAFAPILSPLPTLPNSRLFNDAPVSDMPAGSSSRQLSPKLDIPVRNSDQLEIASPALDFSLETGMHVCAIRPNGLSDRPLDFFQWHLGSEPVSPSILDIEPDNKDIPQVLPARSVGEASPSLPNALPDGTCDPNVSTHVQDSASNPRDQIWPPSKREWILLHQTQLTLREELTDLKTRVTRLENAIGTNDSSGFSITTSATRKRNRLA